MIFNSHVRWVCVVFFVCCIGMLEHRPILAVQQNPLSLTDDESQQAQAAGRFLSVLEKNPRWGTAFDRVYAHHVEFGTLDNLLQTYRKRIETDAKDGVAWLLLGMFEYQRGNDANAVDAFHQASQLRPKDVYPPYYRGRTLLRMGQAPEAVEAFEQALEKQPGRAELLEISLQLGRVHQRAQRPEEALKVWERLESKMPNDPRVLELIVTTLIEEGGYSEALTRLERLTEIVKDDYQKTQFRVQAATLKIKTDRRNEGIEDFESILASLSPTSWLARDVRRRIEEVFLKSGDREGLVQYYEAWIARHPEDIEGMTRLANTLSSAARMPEAMQWMEKALQRAPSRTDLRKSYIAQLVDEKRIQDALKQYELLVEAEPGNPDYTRDWGKLVLKDPTRDSESRQKDATRIWNRMAALRPDDASNLSQVADLFRQNQFVDEAISLYQNAIKLAPDEPQYREYLGEYYLEQKRKEEAIGTWKSIAEGTRRSAESTLRLAEVYHRFGFLDEALIEISSACQLDPKDIGLQLRSATFHNQAGRYDEALKHLNSADKLAVNDDERESSLDLRIDVLQSSDQLAAEIESLSASLARIPDSAASDWYRLARYHESARDWNSATLAIRQALKADPKSIRQLTTAARICEAAGDYEKAVASHRELAANDRRSLGDHLQSIARIEMQLGQFDEAIKVAQELIMSAPGNTEHYEFYAQMCFRVGKHQDGLAALRKALRITPNEPHLILALGAALSEQLKTNEAIEVYWQAFDATDEIDDKTSLIGKLVPLYQQIDQIEKMLERLQDSQNSEGSHRDATICLAQAYFTMSDFQSSQIELEKLLAEDTRDTFLLRQLAKLCENSGDLEGAIQYQRQLVAIAPGAETEFPLANMLYSIGEVDDANEIVIRLTRLEVDMDRVLKTIDRLLKDSNFGSAVAILEPLLVQRRDDWEIVYRAAFAYASSNSPEQGKALFRHLLSLNIPHESLSLAAAAKKSPKTSEARTGTIQTKASQPTLRQSPYEMLEKVKQVRQAVGLSTDTTTLSTSRTAPIWMPEAFGLARMASLAWLMKLGDTELVGEIESAPGDSKSDSRRAAVYDSLYVKALQIKSREIFAIASSLTKNGGAEERNFFLKSIVAREVERTRSFTDPSKQSNVKNESLSDEVIELMLNCFKEVVQAKKVSDFDTAATPNQLFYSSSGIPYMNVGGRAVVVQEGSITTVTLLHAVVRELQLAGLTERSDELLKEFLEQSSTSSELAIAMRVYLDLERQEDLFTLLNRWVALSKKELLSSTIAQESRTGASSSNAGGHVLAPMATYFLKWMGELGARREHAHVLSILDATLDLAALQANITRHSRISRGATNRKASSSGGTPGTVYMLYYGKSTTRADVLFPQPNEYVTREVMRFLLQALEIFARNGQREELIEHLRERAKNAHDEDESIEQLYLGAALWRAQQKQESLTLMTQATDKLADDISFRLSIATMRQSRGEFVEAMEVIDSINTHDPTLSKQRELLALQVAEKLGDRDRAVKAAKRLFGMRLDKNTQYGLAHSMQRLGMDDLANTLRSRIQRQTGSDAATLLSLLMSYQEQGKMEEAKKVAISLLQRTPRTNTTASFSSSTSTNVSAVNVKARTQVLKFLDRTGELDKMIKQTEARLNASQGSVRLVEELIEYYKFAGQNNKISGAIERVVEANPDSVPLRLLAANYYLSPVGGSTSSSSMACRHYLAIIKKKPNAIGPYFSQVVRAFKDSGKSSELFDALKDINIQNLQSPYSVADLLTDSRRDKADLDAAIDLFEKVYNAFPHYRPLMLSRISSSGSSYLWQNERIFEFGKKSIVPNTDQVRVDPWYGLTDAEQSSGKITGIFQVMLQNLRNSSHLSAIEKSIEENSRQMPEWLAGKAMLAIVDLKRRDYVTASDKLRTLLADERTLEMMPPNTCWFLGQEASIVKELHPLAFKLTKRAMSSSSYREIQVSPLSQLVQLGKSLGREEEIRELLLEFAASGSMTPGIPASSSYYTIESKLWVAKNLADFGMPIEAMQLYRELLSDPKELEAAGNYRQRDPRYYLSKVNLERKEAMRKVGKLDPSEAFRNLLEPTEPRMQGKAVLDLGIRKPPLDLDALQPLESELMEMLDRFIKFDVVESRESVDMAAKLLDARLVDLQSNYPNDLSIGIIMALTRMQNNREQAIESVRQLVAITSNEQLPTANDKTRPHSNQLEEAALSIPLWIVARECFQHKELIEDGNLLAKRALEAARLQHEPNYAVAILWQWMQLASPKADHDNEDRLQALLEIASKRPHHNLSSRPIAESTKSIPPLTLEQINLVMYVARQAAEKGMVSLSEKAFRESLLGGMPVADPTPSASLSNPLSRVVTSASGVRTISPGTSSFSVADRPEFWVVQSLHRVLSMWQNDGYPPEEVYQILKDIVLPTNRPTEIYMYVDSWRLFDTEAQSLVQSLVHWAKKAGKLEELDADIDARIDAGASKFTALTVQVMIAIASDKLDRAQERLEQLATKTKGVSYESVQLAVHAAIPAIEFPALQESGFEIIGRFIDQQEQATQNNPKNILPTGKALTRRLNDYRSKPR